MAKTLFQFTEGNAPTIADYCLTGQDPSGSPAMRRLTWQSILNLFNATNGITPILPPGRLTLESGVPVSTADQADKTTLYYTLMTGNKIQLYSGTAWATYTIASELSLDISAFTASKPYDIWAYNNAGTVALDSTVWTNATTRATALAYQDGRLVKAGATTRLYLGTIYMDAASKCQDKTSQRFVWNYYNRIKKYLYAVDTTNTWAYTTATWRAANNSTVDGVGRFSCVVGLSEDASVFDHMAQAANTTVVNTAACGIAIDATNANNSILTQRAVFGTANVVMHCFAKYNGYLSAGYHFIQRTEISDAAGTCTWIGDDNKTGNVMQTGMSGEVMG